MHHNIIYSKPFQGMKEVDDESVDLIIADPPYNISRKSDFHNEDIGYKPSKGDWDILDEQAYHGMMSTYVDDACRVLKPGGAMLTFGNYGSLTHVFTHAVVKDCLRFRDHLIWHKRNPAPCVHRRGLTFAHEIILYFIKRGAPWTFNYEISKEYNEGKQLHNVFRFAAVRKQAGVTRKPPKLITMLIRIYSMRTHLVLDPFMGSGTTAHCCSELERNWIGYECGDEQIRFVQAEGLQVSDAS